MNLIAAICSHLNCKPEDLQDLLFKEEIRANVEKFIQPKYLQTNYLRIPRFVNMDRLSKRCTSKNVYARGGYDVVDYFRIRHKIILNYPDLPVIVEHKNLDRIFYPLECLEFKETKLENIF